MDDEVVFGALADPTRRRILDLLFERDGRTLGDLVEAIDAVGGPGRFGVMKHLRVLEAAALVGAVKVGREKHHYLNPVPIRQIHDRWLDKYRTRSADILLDLQLAAEHLEDQMATTTTTATKATTAPAPAVVSSIYIRATPETVWRALTEPALVARYHGAAIETDWAVGSPWRQRRGDKVLTEGQIVEADPPRRLVQTFHAVWDEAVSADPESRVTWEIEPAMPGVTKVTLIHDELIADSATFAEVSKAGSLILSGLKSLLETGKALSES
jgi:uncharacterized protein YndB with AHSA1/START domain/DNA-binding transcriptional ArsR family regulator